MITGIILASGYSRRMNCNKLMLACDGIPLVERVIRAATASRLQETLLVYRHAEVLALSEQYPVTGIYNQHADRGQSAAIKTGVRAAHARTGGYMFFVADQPFVSPDTVNRLIQVFRSESSRVVVPVYCGSRGNPVLFSSALRQELLALDGDRGGRYIIDGMSGGVQFVDIDACVEGLDVDTAEQYRRCLADRPGPG